MANTLIDLQVAARLGLREAKRWLHGEREPAPDLARFRDALSRARLEAWKKAHPDEAVAPPPATLTQAAFHGE